jgi:hypothetical protein
MVSSGCRKLAASPKSVNVNRKAELRVIFAPRAWSHESCHIACGLPHKIAVEPKYKSLTSGGPCRHRGDLAIALIVRFDYAFASADLPSKAVCYDRKDFAIVE